MLFNSGRLWKRLVPALLLLLGLGVMSPPPWCAPKEPRVTAVPSIAPEYLPPNRPAGPRQAASSRGGLAEGETRTAGVAPAVLPVTGRRGQAIALTFMSLSTATCALVVAGYLLKRLL